jgi:hypothetical protein
MSSHVDSFLQWLKPFNEAGVIQGLGVIATFAAVLVALLPSFWKWKKRPRLQVLLKPVSIKNITGDEQHNRPWKITASARMLVKNSGQSAALKVRAVATDLYMQTRSDPLAFLWKERDQKALTAAELDVPPTLSIGCGLIARIRQAEFDTGFILGELAHIMIGRSSASVTVGGVETTTTSPTPTAQSLGLDEPLREATYILRVVVSARNATPVTRLIRIELTHEIKTRFANRAETLAITKADREAVKVQV